ncbi:UNKNOWN [Stylonychia lemnae]|uniref:Uncharacterized protein n=1 Tax=Stylonychia lemnae TaxID=5949 RepID=A0A077ZW41_STYLE|nr:UNKNOWN [Stylonychia lemnae]|eukprot:CDW73485.1 UNKNOWN [Stylonychia lemnae]
MAFNAKQSTVEQKYNTSSDESKESKQISLNTDTTIELSAIPQKYAPIYQGSNQHAIPVNVELILPMKAPI